MCAGNFPDLASPIPVLYPSRVLSAIVRRVAEAAAKPRQQALDEIADAAEREGLTLVQLHGEEGPSFCAEVHRRTGAKVIKAFRVKSPAEIEHMRKVGRLGVEAHKAMMRATRVGAAFLAGAALAGNIDVYLKANTGMNRLGFRHDNLGRLLPELLASPHLELAAVFQPRRRFGGQRDESAHGLRQALAAQGKTDAAVDADFEKSWARADHWIRSSRF